MLPCQYRDPATGRECRVEAQFEVVGPYHEAPKLACRNHVGQLVPGNVSEAKVYPIEGRVPELVGS